MTRARDVANLIGSGNYSSTTFTATAGQTAFTISHTQGFVQVFMNGLLLDLTVDYTSNGSAITLTSGAAAGDEIEVVKYNTFSVGDAIPASGGTFTGNVNVTGDTASLTLTDTSSHSANTGPGVSFFSKDSGGTSREVAKIVGESHSGSNEGNLAFQTRNGGTLETKWKVYKNGNWLPSNSAYGIYLGTTSAVDANLLDDYEEGTYTPVYIGAGSSGSTSYSYQTGVYTKVGRLCRVWIDMEITGSSGMSGTPCISLPFSASSTPSDMGSFTPWSIHTNFTNSKFATQWINTSTDVMLMYTWTGDTNAGHAIWNVNTTGRISGGLMYQTA